jgi:hypothetical protein
MTYIHRAADDHRVIAVEATDIARRDHRDGEALLRQRLPDRLRNLGGCPCREAAETSTLGTCARSVASAAASVIAPPPGPAAREVTSDWHVGWQPASPRWTRTSISAAVWSCWPRPVRLTPISGFHRCSVRPGQFGLNPRDPGPASVMVTTALLVGHLIYSAAAQRRGRF